MSFWGELKRRNVFKVGVAYIIVGWLILQVASITFPALKLPGWVLTFVMVILIIGLPLALIFTWAFELTADGIKRTEQVPLEESVAHVTGLNHSHLVSELDIKESRKTIAVLPFGDLSKEKDQEYFSDGLSEELINKLSQVKDLQVTARTSSFYFKDKNTDIRTIGETLGVTYLLEGSVRKSENRLRVTAQLIKAVDGYHLFSETYDRELKDIFFIQDEIAKAVTTALSVALGVGEFSRPGMTRNIKAYDEYLCSAANFYKFTPDSMLVAIDQLGKTLDIDPDFGLGWYYLSEGYSYSINLLPPAQTVDFKIKAEDALKRARTIAPDMPELLLNAASKHQENGNWLEAERIYSQIFEERGDSNPDTNLNYGLMLSCVGRSNDALLYLQRAKRLNPMEPGTSFFLAVALFNSKRMDEALVEAKRGQELGGLDVGFLIIEYIVALEKNDRHQAAEIIDNYFDIKGDYPDTAMLRLSEILLMDNRENALSELKELSKSADISPLNRGFLSHVAAKLGDEELAFANLRESIIHSYRYTTLTATWHPMYRGVRQMPVFKTWIREIGLYDYWRTSGKWGDLCRPVDNGAFECD